MMAEEKLAKIKPQNYTDNRPAEYFDRFYERAQTQDPGIVYPMVRAVMVPATRFMNQIEIIGAENIPEDGPVILAPNHASFMDHFFSGQVTARQVRFMAKSQMFRGPFGPFFANGGVFPVRRGTRDEKAMVTAETILLKGGVVEIYCEGGRSRSGEIADTAKSGVGRLALSTKAPVVPMAIWGSHRCRNWKRLEFPKIIVNVGEPIHYCMGDWLAQEVADDILRQIKDLHLEVEDLVLAREDAKQLA